MKNEEVDGIGSVFGGEYDTISFNGIGKLKGETVAKKVIVDGIFKGKGKLLTDELKIDGIARVFREIKAKKVVIDGLLKLRRASLNADAINCDGIMIGNREVCADQIFLDGLCSVTKMYGDQIVLKHNVKNLSNLKLSTQLSPFFKLYFGRKMSMTHSLVDVVECTNLEAEGIKSKIIRANKVRLKGGCVIDKLYCDGEVLIDDTCRVKKLISKKQPIVEKKEMDKMANETLVKILDQYKEGKITADEAEKMLGSLEISGTTCNNEMSGLPWEDDGQLRIVAYIGRKLLKKGDEGANQIEVKDEGESLNVESYGNLTCGNIRGNASAGRSITSGDIGGNVSCGRSVHCKSISGNIAAGGGVHLER